MKRILAIFLCLTLLLAVPAMAEGMKAGTYTETVKRSEDPGDMFRQSLRSYLDRNRPCPHLQKRTAHFYSL